MDVPHSTDLSILSSYDEMTIISVIFLMVKANETNQ